MNKEQIQFLSNLCFALGFLSIIGSVLIWFSAGGAIAALDVAFPCDDGTPRDPNTPQSYGCELSPNGTDPVTHYGSSFVITEEIRQNLENAGLANTPGITYWRCSNPEAILQTTNYTNGVHYDKLALLCSCCLFL